MFLGQGKLCMQEAKLELIKLWIIKADHDLGTAEIILLHLPKYKDILCFHCQQAVEKYLKAYLTFFDEEIPKTHNLMTLLELLRERDAFSKDYYEKARQVNSFAVEIRYPEAISKFEKIEGEKPIAIAKEFRKIILQKLNLSEFKDN